MEWPDLVLAGALVGAFFHLVKNKLDQAVSINDNGTCNASLLSPKHLFTIFRLSASTTMSLLNKFQELQSITVALTLSLSFLLALTAFSSALHSSRKLFTELKELQLMNISFSTKEPFKTALEGPIGSPDFGSSRASRVTF